uniref:Uncharacterized protein n=1 Tax=Strongyloides venezuelensis TaxID=75913 RepID=A0A0K0FST0_STRVS
MECDMDINECSRLCEYNVNKIFEYLYKVFSSDLKLTLKIHNLTHYPWNILRLKLLPVNFSCIIFEELCSRHGYYSTTITPPTTTVAGVSGAFKKEMAAWAMLAI